MTDITLDRKNCGCKYCGTSKQGQKEISQDLGIKPKPLPTPSHVFVKPKVRRVVLPQKQQSPPGSVVNHDRTADLRSSRRFRAGELVWCALSPSIQGEHDAECIDFWPGLVNETRLQSDVLPHESGEPWRVVQSTVYKVKLLAIAHASVVPETAVLPYQAYGPTVDLIEHLRVAGDPALLQASSRPFGFRPVPLGSELEGSPQVRFTEAATPFAFAIQIAAHLVRMWSPTNEWKFHGEVPRPPTAVPDLAQSSAAVEMIETRYQGLWWGAERIWADELVRLQLSRAQVVPQGSQVIYRASPRADLRGMLMRINSIMAVPEAAPKEALRDCKVAGVLYELADETYEEAPVPDAVAVPQAGPVSDSAEPPSVPIFNDSSVAPANILSTPETGIVPSEDSSVAQIPPILPAVSPIPPAVSPNPINLPNHPPYSLPRPPRGYKFRQILKPGYEIVLDVSFIAGRYYPDLLLHPLLRKTLADTNSDNVRVPQLTALCGILAGSMNSMECVDWHATRLAMLKSADLKAQEDLQQHWRLPPMNEGEAEPTSHDVEIRDVQPRGVHMEDD